MSEKFGNGDVEAQDRPADRPSGSGGGGAAPEAFARVTEPPPEKPKKPPLYKRPVPMIILAVVVVAGVVIGLLWYLHSRDWEETDDAFIQADVTQVSPRVAGHVLAVDVTDNQEVKAGDKLVELDPADFQVKIDQAQAAVVAAQKQVDAAQKQVAAAQDAITSSQADLGQSKAAEEAAQTESNRAHDELKRFESLTAEAVTQQQLINFRAAANSADANLAAAHQKTVSSEAHVKSAQSQVQVAEAQVEVAQAQVKQAQASLEEDALQLSYATIHAPIDGHVTNKAVQVGDYVQVGQALMALVPLQPPGVYVIANYKETQLDQMKPGQEVEFTVDAYPGHMFHGTVDSIQRGSGAAFSLLPPENATGNYVKVVQRVPVKIRFDNTDGYSLGPGMSVIPRVKIR